MLNWIQHPVRKKRISCFTGYRVKPGMTGAGINSRVWVVQLQDIDGMDIGASSSKYEIIDWMGFLVTETHPAE